MQSTGVPRFSTLTISLVSEHLLYKIVASKVFKMVFLFLHYSARLPSRAIDQSAENMP